MLSKPSFYATAMTGLLMLLMVFIIFNNWNEIKLYDTYRILMIIGIFCLIIGVHGLLHLGLEFIYKFNPLE
jgi:hypothetical protein